ncbi:DUF6484 domain-containing protein [Nitrococcus mobilis]|uniref:DUF6484 domain-containing protein n=1 Tax=Nitrococcus mobilis Nb-231 TaxID=314278 RepID=A4BPI2_9GAMM|nr:DUF6484 domain-containing protein [Nitrococcus mobilis]EAR22483.1 hypothetical protein NB231_12124 [Nitrococcus mobilis Nb-231]
MGDEGLEVVGERQVSGQSRRIDGVVIGMLVSFSADGEPVVAFPGNAAETGVGARTAVKLSNDDIGCELALMFERGDPARPLVMGRLYRPDALSQELPRITAEADGERLELRAGREIVLRCGRASITLTRAGKILLRGAYLLSRSSGVNRIKGGSVQIN